MVKLLNNMWWFCCCSWRNSSSSCSCWPYLLSVSASRSRRYFTRTSPHRGRRSSTFSIVPSGRCLANCSLMICLKEWVRIQPVHDISWLTDCWLLCKWQKSSVSSKILRNVYNLETILSSIVAQRLNQQTVVITVIVVVFVIIITRLHSSVTMVVKAILHANGRG